VQAFERRWRDIQARKANATAGPSAGAP